jgi:hypothetical protein
MTDFSFILADEDDLRIRLKGETDGVLFEGYGDMLVTSSRGTVELRLNFGEPGRQEYFTLLRAGEDALLLQDPETVPPGRAPLSPIVLPWRAMEELWRDLQYDPSELEQIPPADEGHWLTAWIAGCPLQPVDRSSLGARIRALQDNLLTEDPAGEPSVRFWLESAVGSAVKISPQVLRRSPDVLFVTAYLNSSESVLEWRAIAGADRDLLAIGQEWLVRVSRS